MILDIYNKKTILGTWYRRSKGDNSKTGPREGVEVDPVSERSRIPAHPTNRGVHRASSCTTASTHAFKWVVGSPHASQSAHAHPFLVFPNTTLSPRGWRVKVEHIGETSTTDSRVTARDVNEIIPDRLGQHERSDPTHDQV